MKRLICLVSIIVCLIIFSSLAASDIKVANDPTRLGVGARPLGMGKGFVAISDDPGIMFINPAGISDAGRWQITSMSGNFLNEISYSQFGGVYPTNFGTFGVGYIGSGLNFTAPVAATAEVAGEIRVIPATSGATASYSYANTALLVSYGLSLSNLFAHNFLKDISLGSNLKIFSQSLAGGSLTGGTGSGYDVDLGMLYRPSNIFSLGLNLQNILPASMGGKMVWPASGTRTTALEESYPASLKLGMAYQLMGDESFIKSKSQALMWTLDFDRSLSLSSYPTLMHTGFEWTPQAMIALRFGIDQDIVGTGTSGLTETSSNLTAGVGLTFSDFRFDYAYHQYNSVSDNDTHYFSLCYGLGEKEAAESLVVVSPRDKQIVYDERIEIVGKLVDAKIKKVDVDDTLAIVDDELTFTATLPALVGKNHYLVKGYDQGEKLIANVPFRVVRLVTYKDLDKDYWAKLPVECLATLNIIAGYPDGTFKPNGTLTRAELSTLLVKTKGLEIKVSSAEVFTDVSEKHWAAGYIQAAVDAGYVEGYPDKTFKPSKSINRVEGIVVIARFADLATPEAVLESPFPDLPGRHWAAQKVTAAKQAGLLDYLKDKRLEPTLNLARGEAAELIAKTPYVKEKINNLLTFKDTR